MLFWNQATPVSNKTSTLDLRPMQMIKSDQSNMHLTMCSQNTNVVAKVVTLQCTANILHFLGILSK